MTVATRTALACAGCALVVYLVTLAPTVSYGGDCGDFIASSYTLSNSHPTGYPFYLVLGRLIASIPVGEVALRYNLLSAVAGAIAVGLVAVLVIELTANALAGALSSLSLACCYPFWSQAVIAEVYTVAVAFSVAQLWLAFRAVRDDDRRWLFGFALVSGLALAHHLQAVLVFAPSLVYLLARRRAWVTPRMLALCGASIGAPLALYLYLPLRARAFDFWGPLWQPSAVWAHLTGALYRPHMFALSTNQIVDRVGALAFVVGISFLLTAVLIPVGLALGLKRHRSETLALTAICALNLLFGLPYDVGDWFLFFFPFYLALAVFIGLAADGVARVLGEFRAATALLLLLPLAPLTAAFGRANHRGNDHARRDALAALSQCAPGALLFVRSDELLFSCWYVQRVLGRFGDREVVSLSKLPRQGKDPDLVREAVLASAKKRPTFVAFWPTTLSERLTARGLVCQVTNQPEAAGPTAAAERLSMEVPRVAKRELLMPIVVRWSGDRARPVLFRVANGSTVFVARRTLHPGDGGSGGWRSLLTIEVPPDVIPGRYRISARVDGESAAATVQVVDF